MEFAFSAAASANEDLAVIVIMRRCFSGHPNAKAKGGDRFALEKS